MKMKKSWITIIVIAVIPLFFYSSIKGNSNKMVSMEKDVMKKWADVENVYQRRADLIPNLVATVKGYAAHEQETLTEVIEARAKATSTTIDASNITPENIQAFQQAQSGITSALSKLMVVVERYPDLKANQNFLELQAQLEGTENRIAVERQKFNQSTQDYNTLIDLFPQRIYANIFNFEEKPFFKAQENAEQAPKVEF